MTPVRTVWKAMAAPRAEIALAALLGALASASAVALLGASAWLITYAAQLPPVLSLSVAAVLVRAFALARALGRYCERLVGHDAAFRGLTSLRVRIYDGLERIAPIGLHRFARGDLLSRLVADVDAILDLPLRVVLPWAQALLVSAGAAAFIWWITPAGGALLGVALGLGIVIIPWLVARRTRVAEARIAPTRGRMSAFVTASVNAGPEYTVLGADSRAVGHLSSIDAELTAISQRESSGLALGAGLSVLVQGLTVVAMLLITVPAVSNGLIPPVWFAVAVLLPIAAGDVVAGLPASGLAMQRVRAAAVRISDLMGAQSPVPQSTASCPSPASPITIRDLRAAWDGEHDVLHGVSLSINAGERVAVIGPSGSGKSTLAAVLMGFLPYSGSLTVAGAQLRDIDGESLRERVGLLSQQAHVFETTLAANLRIAHADASDDELLAVLKRVRLQDWLAGLDEGLQTQLTGVRMSGGERQRLAMARLLLAKRDVIILDEPTEHLDVETADELIDDLLDVSSDTTTILITHRTRDLVHVDRIEVLVGGRIELSGTHEQLLGESEWYAARWAQETEAIDLIALMGEIPAGTARRVLMEV